MEIITPMYDNDYVYCENPILFETNVTGEIQDNDIFRVIILAYGLLDGLYDRIVISKVEVKVETRFCMFDLNLEGIKKATE